ncbi:MAG: DUF2207 domain-containing protein [Sphingomonadales bacterium]
MATRLLIALCACLFAALPARAEERILRFEADIQVGADGVLTVTEDITVQAERQQIKRGIFRDFPVRYQRPDGRHQTATFDVETVLRDGRPEDHHLERRGDYRRLYIGSRDRILKPGVYRYTIVYSSRRQLGHFADHDELYWNVTGDQWAFPIEEAVATVRLPAGAAMLDQTAYIGPRGSTEAGAFVETQADGAIEFTARRRLPPGEGFTIVVSWPPGYVERPSAAQAAVQHAADNGQFAIAVIGPLVLLGYFLILWHRVGRDPAAGTLMPRYRPPTGLSPAACRFILEMGFDDKTMAAALVSLAQKGALTISDDDGTYAIERTQMTDAKTLSPGERAVLAKIRAAGAGPIKLKQENHKLFKSFRKALKGTLKTEYEIKYFNTNRAALLVGAGLAALVTLALAATARDAVVVLFMALWLSLWGAGCYHLVARARTQWQMARAKNNALHKLGVVFAAMVAVPFLGGFGIGVWVMGSAMSGPAMAALGVMAGLVIGFYHWLKAPTRAGRRLMDEIEGFREFLGATEQDRLDRMNPPTQTPEMFEAYLPFAIALDVENRWAAQFESILAAAQAPDGRGAYHPRWYHGRHAFSASDFGSRIGAGLASAVSSASTAPSRGGSGFSGGSSGGGGGGGGGGGW